MTEIPKECPMKDMCKISADRLSVLAMPRWQAEQLFWDYDRERCWHMRETGLCQKVNGELCQMTDEHQHKFVEVFIDNDEYEEDEV